MQQNLPKKLIEKLSNLPQKPGVYLYKNRKGQIIYVGKAKVLRNRIRSYFQNGRQYDPKLERLVSQIADVETIITDSEVEALILEANLIKEYKPRYNINLKDDKSYPYIRVTNEPFPRIFPTRRIIKDGSRYFGPYTDVKSLRSLLKTIKSIFPIRSCQYKLTPENIAQRKYRLCLDYHIHKCEGPCEGLVSAQEYNRMIEHVVNFIQGRSTRVVDGIKKQMDEAAAALHFERAAFLRDQLEKVNVFQQRQKVIDPTFVDRDIIALASDDGDSCCVVFKVRDGKVIGRQHFYLNSAQQESEQVVVAAFLKQYYLKADFIPGEIFLSTDLGEDTDAIQSWLTQKRQSKVMLMVPQRGHKARLVKMCQKNATLLLDELKLQKMQAADYVAKSVQALQKDLRLSRPPRVIEAFDISNIQGTDPVASMVCFINGRPNKAAYRKFKIRGKRTPDDFAMMREAVHRRYARLLKEKKDLPDLILIDGGKGQLSAALDALDNLQISDQPVIALAKRLDEVFIPHSSEPQNIRRDSAGLRLLQRIRDEAHRFAITFHRARRKKRTLDSELLAIPGVGPKRMKHLIKNFGSIKKVKMATLEELQKVEGITRTVADNIYLHFHPQQTAKDEHRRRT